MVLSFPVLTVPVLTFPVLSFPVLSRHLLGYGRTGNNVRIAIPRFALLVSPGNKLFGLVLLSRVVDERDLKLCSVYKKDLLCFFPRNAVNALSQRHTNSSICHDSSFVAELARARCCYLLPSCCLFVCLPVMFKYRTLVMCWVTSKVITRIISI